MFCLQSEIETLRKSEKITQVHSAFACPFKYSIDHIKYHNEPKYVFLLQNEVAELRNNELKRKVNSTGTLQFTRDDF